MGLSNRDSIKSFDLSQMRDLAAWTARHLGTAKQSPFCADVVETGTGKLFLRRLNAVATEHDPSSHAEVRVLRAACKKLRKLSLAGYTLYTTCEPCPMCMSMALWSQIDRVVFGATIGDASKHCWQIYIPAKTVARKSDMQCEVEGPVARKECVAIFEDERMQAAMKLWRHGKRRKPKPV
ncbi:MAG TPA: nucleoside deaminase [Candidatus Limnocylindria bacterium]|nr:nucleoside deaminase [Candidatus Limnocylindria bacterium]